MVKQANQRSNARQRAQRNKQRRQNQAALPFRASALPPSLPLRLARGKEDIVPLHLKGVWDLANSVAGAAKLCIALTPQTLTGSNKNGLGDIFPVLAGMRASFGEFCITRIRVTGQLITPMTQQGALALCYENTDSTRNGAPNTFSDAANGVNSAIATAGIPAHIEAQPTDYFNEWLSTYSSTADQRLEEAGIVQVFGLNGAADLTPVAILGVEVDFFFTGYKLSQ